VKSRKKFNSKSNFPVAVRSATIADAADILELSTDVVGEEIYQLRSASEFKMTIEAEQKWIESHRTNPNHLILVAEVELKIVGLLDFSNGHRNRIAHTGEFGMSVAKSFRDQGLGSLLLEALIEWTKKNSTIEKIGLSVHSNNQRAVSLYKKMGFEMEGIRKRDLKYGEGQYVDTVVMGRFV
jgi:RimJ/RimL family protein N-acetyltransferase